ncbi:MAG: hypothetical protein E2O39_11255 [Planctomycetota bacterium]|nr:MAG: hypothetical protein E2O39_11255 [Planctomycetota bacterium]
MNRSTRIAACVLGWTLLGAGGARAQEPVLRRAARKVPALATTVRKPLVQVQSKTDLRAKGSLALKLHLMQDKDWGKKLMSDPALLRELEREPELLRRLQEGGASAFRDAGLVSRVLEFDGVVRMVLADQRAQSVVEQELRGFHAELQGAEAALQRGDQQGAAARFEAAAQEARELGNRPAEAEALLDGARALELLDRKRGKAENAEQILAWYDMALAAGGAPQRSLARNNKGVALLGLGRGSEAIAELERVDYEVVIQSQRHVFRYNLGRAYEQERRAPQAIEIYRGIVEAQPSFRPAVDRLYGLLRESKAPEQIQAAAVLTSELVRRGEGRAALENVKGCLEEWKREPAVPAICEVLVRSYVEGRVSPADYAKTERDFLARIVRGAQDAPTAAYLERFARQLQRVYGDELPIDPSPELARELFPRPSEEWSAEIVSGVSMPQELSRLLKLAGDYYDGGGDPGQALARYLLSWNLDPGNTEALVYVAEMVRRDEALALDGELRALLVSRIFEEKGASYRARYKTAEDWLNILRYHVLLASIFEERGEWGSPGELASVIFQLEHAIDAGQQVRRLGAALAPSPGLHYRLGRAYIASELRHLRPRARPSFLRAARGFLRDANAGDARLALEAASGLGPALDEDAQQQLAELQAALRQLETGR